MAVKKWRPYLLGKPFLIKTDQQSLKFLLDQKVGTPTQQKWIAKLMGYIFQVEYKKGMDNQVADALSRKEDPPQTTMFLLSFPQLSWLDELQQSYATNPDLNKIIEGIQNGNSSFQAYSYNGNVLVYKDRVVLGQNSPLKSRVLHYIHDSPFVGHSGFEKTYQRAKREFFWKGMKKDIKKHVKECDTC